VTFLDKPVALTTYESSQITLGFIYPDRS